MMNKLWYDKPAHFWRQALPIGNGYTGVMVFGGKKKEKLSFNDCTLWSGYPKDQTNSDSLKYLGEVRQLVFNGENDEADKLAMEKLCGAYCESYLPVGDIIIKFKGVSKKHYKRELDIENAIHKVTTDGVEREMFASYPNKVVVYKIKSTKPISIDISAKSKMKTCSLVDCGLSIFGNAPDYVAPNYLRTERKPIQYTAGLGMGFCLRCEVKSNGDIEYKKTNVVVKNATEIELYMVTATGFKGYNKMPDNNPINAHKNCIKQLMKVNKDYNTLKKTHINDFNFLYKKQQLNLNSKSDITTFKLIKNAKKGIVSTALVQLFYNYGKYLMISSSRKGVQAMNLQGVWNASMRPAWSSNYTTNINAQMNYWAVIKSNLSECIEPYISLVSEITQAGKKTAEINYACSGSACNHNVDIWRKTAPVQGPPSYMYAPLCGAWLANEIYSHYKNGGLEQYENKVLEIVKENAKFANDYLVEKDNYFVTCPSASPEATFNYNSKRCNLDYASAFEMGIVKQIFKNYLELFDDELAIEIKNKMPKLYPFKRGKTGILEWHDDYDISEKGHRHFSPLYSFYPANIIKYHKNKEETQWVKELFEYRTNNSKQYIGWSAAWAICLAARLHDSKKAFMIINSMLSHSVFYNLFDVHPPFIFQIDGNMGFVAGINEMLLYEEDNVIELISALPNEWKSGSVEGMVVNNTTISFKWDNNIVTNIYSDKQIKVYNKNISEKAILNNITLVDMNDWGE